MLFTSGSEGHAEGRGVQPPQPALEPASTGVCRRHQPEGHGAQCAAGLSQLRVDRRAAAAAAGGRPDVPVSVAAALPHVPELAYGINATILFGTDTFLAGYARVADNYDFYSVRYVFAGAERVKAETRRVWFEKFGIRILEGYGATETAPAIAVNTPMHFKAGTVGRVLPGIDHRVERVEGIADGGRLFVRGPNVMLGYLRAETPGVLEPPDGGWYDTGDIVDLDAEGFVTIRGRAKRFAKVAGEMVPLGAVEDFIAKLWPDAMHAVVVGAGPEAG